MTISIDDHVAFVTGASRGIGRACAVGFARHGCHLALAARSPGDLETTARQCREHGVEALPIETDVSDRDDVKAAVEHAASELGGLNILVNNAGISPRAPVDRADLDAWEEAVDVNLLGAMYAIRHAATHLKIAADDGERAAIINIASIASKITYAEGGVYTATKHGLLALSGSAFDDLRERGIEVSALCPGYVNTDFNAGKNLDAAKMIQPDDVAHTALFVATYPETGCPTEIVIRPQRTPYLDR